MHNNNKSKKNENENLKGLRKELLLEKEVNNGRNELFDHNETIVSYDCTDESNSSIDPSYELLDLLEQQFLSGFKFEKESVEIKDVDSTLNDLIMSY